MPPIIEVKHLTKEYRLGSLTSIKDTFRQGLARLMDKKGLAWERERFKALDDVSFSIEKGEVVGIIGHNGAGKSTLLKHLANITNPTSGEVCVSGSVAPLIEVGAGLNPELTGRENIYLNGAILGIPKNEIGKKIDGIIGFSELEQFIDTPVKRYSSGMTVKLGFSIATSIDSDILIVDEVLAVGDLAFQRKCFDRMEDLIKQEGRTILVVSHNIRQVERICDRVLLLDHGKVVADGDSTSVCELFYKKSNEKIVSQAAKALEHRQRVRKTGEVELHSLKLLDATGRPVDETPMGDPITIRCELNATKDIERPEIIFGFHTTDFYYISSMGNGHIQSRKNLRSGINYIECRIASLPLVPGVYAIRLGVLDGDTRREPFYGEMLKVFSVCVGKIPRSHLPHLGIIYMPAEFTQR